MNALDYVLYDNWTPSTGGHDWGVKAPTGVLAARPDLQASFAAYCKLTKPGQPLRGFGAALGGFAAARGYMLCVTVESTDRDNRPAWVAVGLWCPDHETLRDVIVNGDVIAAARTLRHAAARPERLAIPPAAPFVRPLRRPQVTPMVVPFDATAVPVARGLLLSDAGPPNVLGITPASGSGTPTQHYEVIFTYATAPQPRAEPLGRDARDRFEEEPWPRALPSPDPGVAPRSRVSGGRDTHGRAAWYYAAATLALIAAGTAAGYLARRIGDDRPPAPAAVAAVTTASDESVAATPAPGSPVTPDVEDPSRLIQRLARHLSELQRLDAQGLRQTTAFVAAETVDVEASFARDRQSVRDAFAALLTAHETLTQPWGEGLPYFITGAGKDVGRSEWLAALRRILASAPPPEACAAVRVAFGAEFETTGSALAAWCGAFERLSHTAAELARIPVSATVATGRL